MFEFFDVAYQDILRIDRLMIGQGHITALTGASGSGKTTLLKMLNKMISPTKGRILYHGKDLEQVNTVQHRRKVVMLSQDPPVFEGDIRENLLIGLRFQEKQFPDDASLVQALERVGLTKTLGSPSDTLSGGEKQRLALARVLLLDPEVCLLDEPSSALDEQTEIMVIEMVTGWVRQSHKSMVMVTHSKRIAGQYADRVIDVSNGSIRGEDRHGFDH